MTEEQMERRYLEANGYICPKCESPNIKTTSPLEDGFQNVKCEDCKLKWTDQYDLIGMQIDENQDD